MSNDTTTTDPATIETGCYIDSHHGIYGIERLVELADGFGTIPANEPHAAAAIQHWLHADIPSDFTDITKPLDDTTRVICSWNELGDWISELYDTLTDSLPVAEGFIWLWIDGELFYGRAEWSKGYDATESDV